MYQANVIPPKIATQTVNPVIQKNNAPPKGGHGHKQDKKINIPALTGSIIGTLIPMFIYKHKQKASSIWKINYEFKEMMYVGTGSILGGMLAGIMQNKDRAINKIKEANFQWIMNLFFPTLFVDQFLKKIDEKMPGKMTRNKKLLKAGSVIAGISIGMIIGKYVTETVNSFIKPKKNNKNGFGAKANTPEDTDKKRKIKFKDIFIHVDDIPIALTLSKVPHVDKLLPLSFAYMGYNAGKE